MISLMMYFPSHSVDHKQFNYQRIIRGVMNWLKNLSQSNRMIDKSHDWVICLMVSRLEEVPRGMGKKRKHDETEVVECQFSVDVRINDNAVDDDDELFPNSMPSGTLPKSNPSLIINVRTEGLKDDEEYQLFGMPSSTHSDDDDVLTAEQGEGDNDDARIEDVAGSDDDAAVEEDNKMDDDAGMLFTPLLNNEALNFL